MVMVSPLTPFQVAPPLFPVNLATHGAAYWENGSCATPGWHGTPATVTPVPACTVPTGPAVPAARPLPRAPPGPRAPLDETLAAPADPASAAAAPFVASPPWPAAP